MKLIANPGLEKGSGTNSAQVVSGKALAAGLYRRITRG